MPQRKTQCSLRTQAEPNPRGGVTLRPGLPLEILMQGHEFLVEEALVGLVIFETDGGDPKFGDLSQFAAGAQQVPTRAVKIDDHWMLSDWLGQDRNAFDFFTAGRFERELHQPERVAGFGPHHGCDKTHQQEQRQTKSNWPR